jgi:pilus assembly protein CpaC
MKAMGTLMDMTKRQRNRMRILGFLILAGLPFSVRGAPAQERAAAVPALEAKAQIPATQTATPPLRPPQTGQEQETGTSQTLHILVGRSLVITSPNRIKRVSLADSAIAEAVVVSPTQVVINGKVPGGVSLILWDESEQSQSFEVLVDIDVLGLTQKIHEVFPAEPVQVETSKDVVMLSGRISSAEVADKILEVVKGSTPKVTSLMEIPPTPAAEISLQVRFAEVNRQAVQQLGVNILRNFGSNMPMSIGTGQFSPVGIGTTQSVTNNGNTSQINTSGNDFLISDLLNVAVFRPDINLDVFIKALQENNVLEILAEPNLLTESGKQASFLAGGQFPYPVVQGTGGSTGSTSVTIQFKEYGVRLSFTPTLMPGGVIHLKVEPEVSSLDYTNAVTLQGFVLPGVATNRVDSEMNLKDGQSFAIAGLLDNRVTEQFQKIPGIGDIPILGKLFQSRSMNKSDNELLVLVTPHIVQPLAPTEVPAGPVFPLPFMGSTVPVEQKPPSK